MRESRSNETVGRIVGLWRYPVKSMGAEALVEVNVGWHGLEGDRRWAFVREGTARSGFPWLTLREHPTLSHYVPSFVEPDRPDSSPTVVRTPAGASLDVVDPALADEIAPKGARVIRQDRGNFDTFPLSLISTQTVANLGSGLGDALDLRRFRSNILVEAHGELPFPEDEWVGRTLRLGSLRMRVDKRDGRCVVITVDPDTGERDPRILKSVVSDRDGCLGVYGTTVEPGRVAVGDAVEVME
jgi:uncharacterized protein YcbX